MGQKRTGSRNLLCGSRHLSCRSARWLLICYFSEHGTPTGIRLNSTAKPEELDFAENLLISPKYKHIHVQKKKKKKKKLQVNASRIVLTINTAKAKMSKLNTDIECGVGGMMGRVVSSKGEKKIKKSKRTI